MVKTITYEGHKIKYEDSAFNSWKTMKMLASGVATFEAWDAILCGKADEVAEKLNDSLKDMQELLNRITAIEGNAGKN